MVFVQALFEHQQPPLVELLVQHLLQNIRPHDLVDIRQKDDVVRRTGVQSPCNAIALIVLAFPVRLPAVLVDAERRWQFVGKLDLKIDDLVGPGRKPFAIFRKVERLGTTALRLVRFHQDKLVDMVPHLPKTDFQKVEFVMEDKTVVELHAWARFPRSAKGGASRLPDGSSSHGKPLPGACRDRYRISVKRSTDLAHKSE